MTEDAFSERLKRLENRIDAARSARAEPVRRVGAKYTQGSLAWRMVTELVAGMLLGLALGWGLDSLLGTGPAFLVVFVLLGFAAGVRVMMRTASDVREGRSEGAMMRQAGVERAGAEPAGDSRGSDGDDRA